MSGTPRFARRRTTAIFFSSGMVQSSGLLKLEAKRHAASSCAFIRA
jgi:hypothetical protein